MKESHYIYPYDEDYRDPRGCLRSVLVALGVLLAGILILFTSCRAQNPIAQTRDSVRVEVRRDSVYVYQHDSIFRDRWRAGDTVYVTTEKWRVQWRDRLHVVHDTLATVRVETVEVRVVPTYYKWCSWLLWLLVAVVVLRIVWIIFRKFYLHV